MRMSGATLQAIADRLGYHSRQAAWAATKRLLDRQEREVAAEWRVLHVARLERLLMAVWTDAIAGDDRGGQQALRILVELGNVTGVSRPKRVEAFSSNAARERPPTFAGMSEDEWFRRYEIARTEAPGSRRPTRPDDSCAQRGDRPSADAARD